MNLLSIAYVLTLLLFEVSAEQCPELYKRYSKDHTYCKPPNEKCRENMIAAGISIKDIQIILEEHNTLRSKIAIGKEQDLPTASNMLQMVWDPELAAIAQKLVDQCGPQMDCYNCRRVQNFEVGQNFQYVLLAGYPFVPTAEWKSAVQYWYSNKKHFKKENIEPFVNSGGEFTKYATFSQLAWAETWRIGCGFVSYKYEDMYVLLYACNYGPGGNMQGGSTYKQGSVCSACPMNSCCGESCDGALKYPGLCKITDNQGPKYMPQGQFLFYCDFQNQSDCNIYMQGTNRWLIHDTFSGSYLGTILKAGEESTIVFVNTIKPTTSAFCMYTEFRRGPNVDGQEDSNLAVQIFSIVGDSFIVPQQLPQFHSENRHQFSTFKIAISWNMETQVKLKFQVPFGKPDQFFEVSKIYAKDEMCRN